MQMRGRHIPDVTDWTVRARYVAAFSRVTGTAENDAVDGRQAIAFAENAYGYMSVSIAAGAPSTMMAWVRNAADGCLVALSNEGGFGNRLYGLYNIDGELRVRDNISSYPVAGGAFSSNTWNHVALTYAGSGTHLGQVYIDGQRVAYGEIRTMPYGLNRFYANSWGASSGYAGGRAGYYSDIRLYSRELSADEVQQTYLARL